MLSGVPAALPSLIKAYRIQDKARNVGFDWEEREQVWDKVKEEIQEFQDEVAHMDKQKAEEEFGDVMFSLINAARLYKINPDNALEHTNQKFIRRFNYVEAHSIKEGKNLHDMTLEEMDKLWEEAKALENKNRSSVWVKQMIYQPSTHHRFVQTDDVFLSLVRLAFRSLTFVVIMPHPFQQLPVKTHLGFLHQI